jgi:bifunctional UDP-N-acetylglucosamine pyrophosphorylase / glucosamine-1-phosphate N-acetyltransferase
VSVVIADYVERWATSLFSQTVQLPWLLTDRAPEHIRAAFGRLDGAYRLVGDTAVHQTAQIESGAMIKGPVVIGPRCFVSGSALLRGGVFLEEDCIVGPAVELKATFVFKGSKVAHLSFVGDSILGSDVNLESGSVIANYRNELADKRIRISWAGRVIDTGVVKFGALVGDGSRVGANAVIAPGALLPRDSRVGRLVLVDQYPAD